MNYCRKCQSDYDRPGTCNCFASPTAAPSPQPWVPVPGTTTIPVPYTPPAWVPVTVRPFTVWTNGFGGTTDSLARYLYQ